MGSGFGHIEIEENTTLEEALKWIQKNAKTWGVITIYRKNNSILRCFDYDLYNNTVFYHHLNGWNYKQVVKKVTFDYCFMGEDIDIYIQ